MTDVVLRNAVLLDPATGGYRPETSLVVRAGVIVADDAAPAATDIDLRGAVVVPGLIDGHTHPVSGADLTRGVDLSPCTDLAGVRTELARARAALRPGEWLHGWGLDPNVFGDRPISADTVGPVLDGVPAVLRLFDAHSTLASHRALESAGVTGPRRFDEFAEVVCDPAGRPTGLLLEEPASMLVEEAAPKLTDSQFQARVAEVLRVMAAAGLTGGHMMEGDPAERAVLRALEERGELPLRLRLAPWCRPDSADVDALIAAQGSGGELWRVHGVKLFMDGTIDNGTAWLEKPDCHGESTHAYWPDPDRYSQIVTILDAAGVPTATHAIGDAAVRHVLSSLEKSRNIGHRIEHIETLPDDLVPLFAQLGVTASMQPTHCCEFTRADHTDNWSRRLGPERAARAWRCRDLFDAGANVILGSDWPIAPFPPLAVMAGARHRRPARDMSRPPHGPSQSLTPLQALQGMTINAGSGRLAVGDRADLTVLAEDPLLVADADLAELPVRLTVTGGRITHRAADL
ncbi:amidohydrolase [Actinoplanes sp. OR16]|uniref:amidohydrolase n=1 Tax=Actinoplanes sp. OR16 TaxID=946334 RepID=UPI000F6E380C|nr:amidohydrolase [Actinoplanes sp. OR16]BBH70036.1 amidohydrolase [Actinoplanes sp. OR16]